MISQTVQELSHWLTNKQTHINIWIRVKTNHLAMLETRGPVPVAC